MKDLLELELDLEFALRRRLANSYKRLSQIRRHTENPLMSERQRLLAMDTLAALEGAYHMFGMIWETRLALIDRLSTDPLLRTRVSEETDQNQPGSSQ